MRARGDDGESHVEILAGGRDKPKLSERLPERWRRRGALAVALLIGLSFGGYAGYSWPDSQAERERRTVQLTASVGDLEGLNIPYPPYRLTLQLRNTGTLPVTVERARLDLPGYDTFAARGRPRELSPGEPGVFHYGVYPKCDRSRPGSRPPSVHVRVRPESDEARTVTLPASNMETGLRSGYAIVCALPPASLGVQAQTLATSIPPSGSFHARLRLETDPSNPESVPNGLRLLNVRAELAGLEVDSNLPGTGTWAMPSTVSLRLRVENCANARQSLDEPAALRVALVSDSGPYLMYAHTDTDFGTALQRLVAGRCGEEG